jgi:hypothetical protein
LSDNFDDQKIPYTLLQILNNGANADDSNSQEKFQPSFKLSKNMIKEISGWIDRNCQQIFLKLLEDAALRKKSNSGLHGVWGVPGRK